MSSSEKTPFTPEIAAIRGILAHQDSISPNRHRDIANVDQLLDKVAFIRDLTGKPVRIVAQAFHYAGYQMTPDDLREWVSQALRCGASAITYYEMDSPRWTDPPRWQMMLHLSSVITRMNRVALPATLAFSIWVTSDRRERDEGREPDEDVPRGLVRENVVPRDDAEDDHDRDRGERDRRHGENREEDSLDHALILSRRPRRP